MRNQSRTSLRLVIAVILTVTFLLLGTSSVSEATPKLESKEYASISIEALRQLYADKEALEAELEESKCITRDQTTEIEGLTKTVLRQQAFLRVERARADSMQSLYVQIASVASSRTITD